MSVPCGFTITLQSVLLKQVLHNKGDSLDSCPTLLPLPQARHAWSVCSVEGIGVWRQGKGNDLQQSVLSARIITVPGFWQDTIQQHPTRPGPKPEGSKLRSTVKGQHEEQLDHRNEILHRFYIL